MEKSKIRALLPQRCFASTPFRRGLSPRAGGIFGILGVLADRIRVAALQLRSPCEKVPLEEHQGAGAALLLEKGLRGVTLKDERGKMEQISLLKEKRRLLYPANLLQAHRESEGPRGAPAAGFK